MKSMGFQAAFRTTHQTNHWLASYIATHDQLSGLLNRTAFNEKLDEAIIEA